MSTIECLKSLPDPLTAKVDFVEEDHFEKTFEMFFSIHDKGNSVSS